MEMRRRKRRDLPSGTTVRIGTRVYHTHGGNPTAPLRRQFGYSHTNMRPESEGKHSLPHTRRATRHRQFDRHSPYSFGNNHNPGMRCSKHSNQISSISASTYGGTNWCNRQLSPIRTGRRLCVWWRSSHAKDGTANPHAVCLDRDLSLAVRPHGLSDNHTKQSG